MDKKGSDPQSTNQQQQPRSGKRQMKKVHIFTELPKTKGKTQPPPIIIEEIKNDTKVVVIGSDWLTTGVNETQKQIELQNAESKLIYSLDNIPGILKHSINDKLRNALIGNNIYVNIIAFTIIKNRYCEYDKIKMGVGGGEYYEKLLNNDFEPVVLTRDDLGVDLINFERRYSELLQICSYLEQMKTPLHYTIYKRGIEMVDNTPIHEESDFLDKYFMPKRIGFYYAIIVNLGLTYIHRRRDGGGGGKTRSSLNTNCSDYDINTTVSTSTSDRK